MADFVTKLGKTRLGYKLWKLTKTGPLRPVVAATTSALRSVERAIRRKAPNNRAHDQAQRVILAQFEAETRSKGR